MAGGRRAASQVRPHSAGVPRPWTWPAAMAPTAAIAMGRERLRKAWQVTQRRRGQHEARVEAAAKSSKSSGTYSIQTQVRLAAKRARVMRMRCARGLGALARQPVGSLASGPYVLQCGSTVPVILRVSRGARCAALVRPP